MTACGNSRSPLALFRRRPLQTSHLVLN